MIKLFSQIKTVDPCVEDIEFPVQNVTRQQHHVDLVQHTCNRKRRVRAGWMSDWAFLSLN